jgi:hypothetical protein
VFRMKFSWQFKMALSWNHMLDYGRSENCFEGPVKDFQSLGSGSDVSDVSARKQTGHILVPKTHWKWYTVKFSLQKINI